MADRPDPTDEDHGTDADQVGYGEALAELEAILDEIEDDAVDVDVLAARVTRAAELLRVCRDRITAARVEVEQIVADLEPGAGATASPAAAGDDALDDA
jgi:exodeoxyribonuclease VII small subunit